VEKDNKDLKPQDYIDCNHLFGSWVRWIPRLGFI
jgi:hypothetical protein